MTVVCIPWPTLLPARPTSDGRSREECGNTPGVVHMAKPTLLPEKAYGTSNYFVLHLTVYAD
jgi:hypothetical protein